MAMPIAIAEARPAAAEQGRRAVIELIVEPAMVRAVETALAVEMTMVAKRPRQCRWQLPVGGNERLADWRVIQGAGKSARWHGKQASDHDRRRGRVQSDRLRLPQ